MVLYNDGKKYQEYQFKHEEEFEAEEIKQSKLFFGNNTIFIDAKRKIDSKSIGATIPDGFLFDLSEPENPEFYLVEVELSIHDFYRHIFPQITKFFAFTKMQPVNPNLWKKFSTLLAMTAI